MTKHPCGSRRLALLLLQLFQVHVQGLLDGVSGDETGKILDVGLSLLDEVVRRSLSHHALRQLPRMV